MNFYQSAQRLLSRPLFSYVTIFLLQLKVVWRIWDFKDLSSGDTSSYFQDAHYWFDQFLVNIVWSPLYTSFYGSLLHVFSNIYAASIIHRLIIVFAASTLVLAVMRRLLPCGIAWLVTAWWVILPINFDTLYEIHLFSLLPLLCACLLILHRPSSWMRGWAVAALIASSVLVRNELAVVAVITTGICIIWEAFSLKQEGGKAKLKKYWFSYGVPSALALLSILFFYNRSRYKFPEISLIARDKHVLNICQVYAFGYQQRHPEWTYSPWTECTDLMQKTFGQPMPSAAQALMANPAAFLEHAWWNVSLTLNGIQVSLFNASSGKINPDYIPTQLNVNWVIFPSFLIATTLIVGLTFLCRERQYWWDSWLQERVLGWSILLSNAFVTCFLVIPTQRPRPSYMFGFAVLLMAAVGMSLLILFHRWAILKKLQGVIPIVAIALLVIVPPHYKNSERRLLDLYSRFQPFQSILARNTTVLLTREYSFELCSYLMQKGACQPLSYADKKVFADITASTPLEVVLEKQKVNLFYADANLIAKLRSDPNIRNFPANLYSAGWKLIGNQSGGNSQWMLFQNLKNYTSHQVTTSTKAAEDYCLKGLTKDISKALSVPDCIDIAK
jgi:hypothetical protein